MNKKTLLDEILETTPRDIKREVDLFFDISDRINALFVRSGITQKELAHRMGKRESEVSKMLSGLNNFTLRTLAKLEAALGKNIIEVAQQEKESVNVTYVITKLANTETTVDLSDVMTEIKPSKRPSFC